MSPEEQLIKRYFDAFNRHDIEGVVACFHDEAVLVGPGGKRVAGIAEGGVHTRASSRWQSAVDAFRHWLISQSSSKDGALSITPRGSGTSLGRRSLFHRERYSSQARSHTAAT